MKEHPQSMLEALKDPWNQWQVIATLLLNSQNDVSLPESGPIPSIPKWLVKIPEDEMTRADDHCHTYSSELKWPNVEGPVRYQLFFRVLCASEYAAIQGQLRRPWPPDVVPWPQTLPFLLVDLWRKHRHQWAANRLPDGGKAFRKPLLQAFDGILVDYPEEAHPAH